MRYDNVENDSKNIYSRKEHVYTYKKKDTLLILMEIRFLPLNYDLNTVFLTLSFTLYVNRYTLIDPCWSWMRQKRFIFVNSQLVTNRSERMSVHGILIKGFQSPIDIASRSLNWDVGFFFREAFKEIWKKRVLWNVFHLRSSNWERNLLEFVLWNRLEKKRSARNN